MADEGSSPEIRLLHDATARAILAERDGVGDDAWDEVAILLADDLPPPGYPMAIRPERLVSQRLALRGVLSRHGLGLRVDEGVQHLLANSIEDDQSIRTVLQGGDAPPPESAEAVDGPLGLQRELRLFQSRDLRRLIRLRHGANFSVPGAGKTTVTYALHLAARRSGRVDKLLTIAPLSAFGAWEEEAIEVVSPPLTTARWRGGPVPEVDVVLVNYQRLPGATDTLSTWMTRHRVHLVVDEAHRAKRGALGGWGRALMSLAPLAARRDILTGTPAPNHPRDLAALLDILWPGRVASGSLPRAALAQDPAVGAMASVNDVVRPLYVRTTKEELELPPVEIVPTTVRPGPLQRAVYDAMLSRYAGMFDLDRRDSAMFAQMGEVAMYLLQAASSPRLLASTAGAQAYRYPPLAIPPGSRLARLVEDYADHEVPAKIAHACAIVRDNAVAGRKTLVWSNFPDNLLDLEQQLAALQPAIVYGAIPALEDAEEGIRTRERELERFRSHPNCTVLLANPAAMSEGVSLHHACHDAVYVDRTFNAGQYLQSLDRIHRLGLDPSTTTRITLLISSGTIDERVDRRVREKTHRLSTMLDDPSLVQMALPDEDDYGAPVDDPGDLKEILAHLREARPQGSDG